MAHWFVEFLKIKKKNIVLSFYDYLYNFFSFKISTIFYTFLFLFTSILVKNYFFVQKHARTLNICFHHEYLPISLIKDFEAEFGIHVHQTIMDGMESLFMSLLNKNSGYDLVYLTESPFFQRAIVYDLLEEIPTETLHFYKLINAWCFARLRLADPRNKYGIPLLSGTLGFYTVNTRWDAHEISKFYPKPDSLDLIFNEEALTMIAADRVVLPDSYLEVLQSVALWRKIFPYNLKKKDIRSLLDHLHHIRNYWYRFESNQFLHALLNEEILLAYGDSGFLKNILEMGLENTISFTIPKEGSVCWIDTVCVPKKGDVKTACLFIDFLLRPKNMALLSKHNVLKSSVGYALNFIPRNYIFLSHLSAPTKTHHESQYHRDIHHVMDLQYKIFFLLTKARAATHDHPEFAKKWLQVKFAPPKEQ